MGSLRTRFKFTSLLALAFLLCSACAPARPPVPVGTVPPPQPVTVDEEQYGHNVLAALSEKYQLDYSHPRHAEVERIVERLTKSIGADKDPWHVFVFADPLKNAAATRGNHLFIWTGMIDATRNEAELAAIISHEVGHVLARHTDPDPNEEMQKILISIGAMAAGIAASAATRDPYLADAAGQIAQTATEQIGAGLIVNPYSREREAEADHIGLFLMASAGYDPQAAIEFWTRAQGDPSFGSGGFSFLSTHPPADERLARLSRLLPRAKARFEGKPDPGALAAGPANGPADRSTIGGTPGGAGPGAGAGAGGGGGDSFDIRKKRPAGGSFAPTPQSIPGGTLVSLPGSGPKQGTGKTPGRNETWVVVASEAKIFEKPDAASIALGSLRRGEVVEVASTHRGWLAITSPQKGYLRGVFLEPSGR